MLCNKCGASMDDGVKFCTSCGAAVEDVPADPQKTKVLNAVAPATPVVSAGQSADATNHGQYSATSSTAAFVPTPAAEVQSAPKGRSSKKKILIAAAIVVLIVAALAVVFFVVDPLGVVSDKKPVQNTVQAKDQQAKDQQTEPASSASSEVAVDSQPAAVFTGVTSASASSVLPTGGVNSSSYAASNVLDGNVQTAWTENASGSGIGESITLSGNGVQLFSGFKINNGYQKSQDIYEKNCRPKSIEVLVDGVSVGTFSLQDSGLTQQSFTFSQPVEGTEITFVIKDVYNGSSYNDCCISEIEVF